MRCVKSVAGVLGVLVWLFVSAGYGPAHGKGQLDSRIQAKAGLCAGVAGSANYQSESIVVTVCPSTVTVGHDLHFVARTLRGAAVRVTLQYPDGTITTTASMADKEGLAVFTLPIRYNPINRYAQAQFTVTSYRQNKTYIVSGTVTIAQATPVANVEIWARPENRSDWCPSSAGSCEIRDNSTLVILVSTVANAQVSVSLVYPDSQSILCPRNDLTHNAFSNTAGAFQCKLPVVYNGQATAPRAKLLIQAQVTADGFTESHSLSLGFLAA